MGAGVSLPGLASAVAHKGGLGVISSAGLQDIVSGRDHRKFSTYEATRIEIERAKQMAVGKPIGINVMCALARDFEPTIKAALDAKVDAIISGAGLPLSLPFIQRIPDETALIPIISSARALKLITKRWGKKYRPDAVVVEGPRAGGHLGFRIEDLEEPEYQLENLLPPVLDVAEEYGGFPVIVAGGIFTHEDIKRFLNMGASGVQIATRFLATEECDAPLDYKMAVVSSGKDNIKVVAPGFPPSSPCYWPFRVLTISPILHLPYNPECTLGYVRQRDHDGNFSICPAMLDCENFLCICRGLISSAGYGSKKLSLYTVGANAYRVDKIVPVAELMKELVG